MISSASLQEHIAADRRMIKDQILAEQRSNDHGLSGLTRINAFRRDSMLSPWSETIYRGNVCDRHAQILGDYVKARFYEKVGEVIGDTYWDEETGFVYISKGLYIETEEEQQGYTDIIQWGLRESVVDVARWHMRGAIEEIFTVRGRTVAESKHALTNVEIALDANDATDSNIITKVTELLEANFPSIGDEAQQVLKNLCTNTNTWLSDLIGAATQFVRFEYRPMGA